MKLDEIDLTDLDFFVHGDPQAVFRSLRAEVPVYWHERKPGQGFWAASSYEDALKVYHDPTTYSSERGISLQFNQGGTENGGAGFGMMMITTVPPRHSRVRRGSTAASRRARSASTSSLFGTAKWSSVWTRDGY